jgi:hypothetical protein
MFPILVFWGGLLLFVLFDATSPPQVIENNAATKTDIISDFFTHISISMKNATCVKLAKLAFMSTNLTVTQKTTGSKCQTLGADGSVFTKRAD